MPITLTLNLPDFLTQKTGRLTQLLLLATTVLVYSVMEMAIANSLFLSHVGADQLPIAFTLIGLCSIPAYALFSQVVDRYSRPNLFQAMLGVAIAMAIGLNGLLALETPWVYYVLLITIFFQWDFHNNILYASLLPDYFTALEYKRHAPFVGMAQAVGTLIGGGLTAWLSLYIKSPDLLLWIPVVQGLAIAQLCCLTRTQSQIDSGAAQTQVGLLDALKTFPTLVKRYPLMLFLASSSFLLVIIYLTAEYLWFSVYAQNFTDEALTGFLGLMRVSVSIIQVVVLYCVTRPLLHWAGVARMNVVYPLTTLLSLIGLAFNINLKSAIGLHLNGDALYKSINIPVHQLNYNAIPREFLGRIRTLSDGFFYAVGLTTVGLLLWVGHTRLTLEQITWVGVGLAILLLLLRIPMGRYYAQGLEGMIRSDTIDLDRLVDIQGQLPPQSSEVLRELIAQGDRYTQVKALELAAAVGSPDQFWEVAQPLMASPDVQVRRALVKLFSSDPAPQTLAACHHLLQATEPVVQAAALEILIATQTAIAPHSLRGLLMQPQPDVQVLAAIAASQPTSHDPTLATDCTQILRAIQTKTTHQTAIRAIAASQNPQLIPILQPILAQGNPEVKQEGLAALATLAPIGDRQLGQLALAHLTHADPLVRQAAVHLLGQLQLPDTLETLGLGLADSDPRVRAQVAEVLARQGDRGLNIAQQSLASPQPETVEAAIAVLGKLGTRRASNLIYEYLLPDLRTIAQTSRWQHQIPQTDPNWRPLAMTLADYHQRLVQRVLYVLSCLGHARTVNAVNQILNTPQSLKGANTKVANAVEVLASLRDRRFVLPLLPILENPFTLPPKANASCAAPQWVNTKGYRLLLDALNIRDRWVKVGALIALASVPTTLANDPDPIVQQAIAALFPTAHHPLPSPSFMNRLLLLKDAALFKNLSLDELMLIDQEMEQEQVLAGETIFTEGSWGYHFYLIAAGHVQLVKDINGQAQELKQLSVGNYFGEVALFDDAPRWNGAIALEDCTLLKLDKGRFLSLMTQRPHIILEICRFLSQRLRETDRYRLQQPQPSTLSDSRP